jgi:phosphoglycolate phosphatase-like HAD superfamily hydrolase
MKIKNIKGIIWDLDGTLIDSFAIFESVIADIVKERGYTMPSQETILHNYHGSLEDSIKGSLGIESIEELESVVESFLVGQNEHYKGNLDDHLFSDAAKLAQVAAKKSLPQVLVTNRAHKGRGFASPRHIIASTFLADCIQEVRAGDEVDFNKPDKRVMGDWLTRHDLHPEDVIVIGDQAVDGELAANLGSRAILVKRGTDIPHFDSNSNTSVLIVDALDNIEFI